MFLCESEGRKILMVQLEISQAGDGPSYSKEGQAFCSVQAFRWMKEAIHIGESIVLYTVHQFKQEDHPETTSQTRYTQNNT